ncbi:MAG: uroporphyrinogen decarboxylase family protein [Bacteriovoracaceae bacterium]
MNNIFEARKKINGKSQVPVWFMRQAGRYHSHYQNIKKTSDFMTMCKNPELACEVTMGPIQDFKFNAAILFSDLLFPLEHLGMGLTYEPGPKLSWHLEKTDDLKKLKPVKPAQDFFKFQAEACRLLVNKLPQDVTLLGFVGAPFTLYTYAVEGSHAGNLVSSRKGFYDGRFQGFCETLFPELIEEMVLQVAGGADAVALFDTAAGELSPFDYERFVVPEIRKITAAFKAKCPFAKIIYYSKHTNFKFIDAVADKNIDVIGVDWRLDLKEVLNRYSKDYYIQGNIDPIWLHLPWEHLENNLKTFWKNLEGTNHAKWICGLGHGVTIETPEMNVKKTVEFVHQNFLY